MSASFLPSADVALADLLTRCRRREPAAQQTLYERFAGPMFLLALRYAPTTADAEDALQDAFLKVFQLLDDQVVPGAFAGWVRRIVIRTALNAGRSRRVRRADFELADIPDVPAPEASAIEQLTFLEVQALIDRLPEGCRHVLLLYTIEGYSHAEIAALLGVGESASKAQLTRARQRLTVLVQSATIERTARLAAPAAAPHSETTAPPAHFHPLTALLFQ